VHREQVGDGRIDVVALRGGEGGVGVAALGEPLVGPRVDVVVLFTALGGAAEPRMVRTLAAVGRECAALGMPLIAEAEFPTTYAQVEELKEQYGFEYLRRNVRLCAELGADVVKTNWPGHEDLFGSLVEAASGIPVVLAGGSRVEDGELLWRMERAMAAGGIGCSSAATSSCTARPRRSRARCPG
jgi:DhnA family fructose-bisphosphate aldolase class Ia